MRDWYERQSNAKKKAISARVVAAARGAGRPRADTAAKRARTTVGNAIRDGRIKKPRACQNCGSTRNVEAHHPNHARPMAVRFLCSTCHGKTQRG